MKRSHIREAEGLYDPALEHDSCGVGFVANVDGKKTFEIIRKGIEVVVNLDHRGACGCDPRTGDGSGILLQIPDEFFRREVSEGDLMEGGLHFDLPPVGQYGVGMVFLPQVPEDRHYCQGFIEETLEAEGFEVLGWRKVPVDNTVIGEFARDLEPHIEQVFVKPKIPFQTEEEFERRLYICRKIIQKAIRDGLPRAYHYFYIASLSCRTIVYKGMLISTQLSGFFRDLENPEMKSALAIVHQRYSTNTFPTWDLAHPFRYLAHNGEINTLRGNINWMTAREYFLRESVFGEDAEKILPICRSMGSDSALLDNALEFLLLGGRSIEHAMMMMIPEAWENNPLLPEDLRAFYEFHAAIMEPWDGPAAVAFSDGRKVGALLDRNGLRPARYTITKNGFVVLASETGVLNIPADEIAEKNRLRPGKMLLIDTSSGKIEHDEEIKERIASRRPYRQWLIEHKVELRKLKTPPPVRYPSRASLIEKQQIFGYTREDLSMILAPMAVRGQEPVGSMGMDVPLAVLSDKPQLLYNYFKQTFAQVTNPPIDPIREEAVMSTMICVGGEGNVLDENPMQCHQIELEQPILTNEELEQIRHFSIHHFRTITLPILYHCEEGGKRLQYALDELCRRASDAVAAGYSILILSDRHVDAFRAPIPALLAVGAVHQHLIREGTRTKVGILLESGEPREVHHFALLLGYGASAVNPYLAFETIDEMARTGQLEPGLTRRKARENYVKAIRKGLLKIMSKMGISTLLSYHGAQIFEALGISQELIDRHFTGTPSRIGGIGMDVIAEECRMRHEKAFPHDADPPDFLDPGGVYFWRRDGERHIINPETVSRLQKAVTLGSFENYLEYARIMNEEAQRLTTLRSLLRFRPGHPVPLEEVEPASEIVKRFVTGAMSFGSISREAHTTLAIAMNRIGGKSNTGEGGEDPERFRPLPNGDSACSKIKQVASGRFGVTTEYLVNAEELQIKIAQGAKPGEGGQLPGHKVNEEIARVRHSTPGVGLISPPPHHDIYSIEDLAQLIFDLHNVNPEARVSVKLVSETGVGTIAAGVSKGKADMVLISGYDGGTGASPISSIRHAGTPWELGLSETHQVLVRNDLRGRIRVQVDGKLTTGRDLAIAALLGAEEFGFSTFPLITMGCIMMRKCHLNTCPVGIATQDPELRRKFAGTPERVVNFFFFLAEDLRRIMADLGFRTVDEMVGRTDRLEPVETDHWKAKHLDLSALLHRQRVPRSIPARCVAPQDHGTADVLDKKLIALAKPALERGEKVRKELSIRNVDRTTGTMLSGQIARRYGHAGLPEDTIHFTFRGSAGQSFGAWGAAGLTLELIGDANDYLGKGLSGARIIVKPEEEAAFLPEENIIVGNVVLYGAICGELFARGRAGERFAVRNSGAHAVVEGVGDHGCEYMTGGRVIVLGPTGRNFAAGMSGGIAYVYDADGTFPAKCNTAMVGLESLAEEEEIAFVKQLIARHIQYTGSTPGQKILDAWDDAVGRFVKVMPHDYKRVLAERRRKETTEGVKSQPAVAVGAGKA